MTRSHSTVAASVSFRFLISCQRESLHSHDFSLFGHKIKRKREPSFTQRIRTTLVCPKTPRVEGIGIGGTLTLKYANCKASCIKASGLILHFFIIPFPN